MKRVLRQWLAVVLSLSLLLTLLPAAALAEEADGATGQTTAQEVQDLIDELPVAEEITADNRADVQAQIDAIDAAMAELTEDQTATLDTARYDAAIAALLALDAPSALDQVQALIEALPDAEEITADNRADVQAQIDAIDAAILELTEDQAAALDTARYDAAAAALLALDVPSALEQVQALIDALPDAEEITADNRTDVEAQLTAIDEAKLALEDEEVDALDITRYMAAVEAILALDDMAGANVPKTIATESNIKYMDWNSSQKKLEEKTCTSATKVESGTTTWNNGWYVVSGEVTISSRISVSGTVHLILTDGCKLQAEKGITVNSSDNLFIYGQANQTGVLTAGPDGIYDATIGGTGNNSSGKITISGGTITATQHPERGYGAAIGGGDEGSGDITINGGTITATGSWYGAAIGGGGNKSGDITINGGTITTTSCEFKNGRESGPGGGIGGGRYSSGSKITINGGTVNATSVDGYNAINGCLYTGENGNAAIRASSISDKSQQGSWSGIIFEGKNGQVYGNQTVKSGFAVNDGERLAVPATSTLTVPDGVTVTNKGTIEVWGELEGDNRISGSGNIIYYRLDVTAPTFAEAEYGYTQLTEQNITIKNNNVEATIESVTVDNDDDFEIVGTGSKTVAQGGTITDWRIRPKTGLTAGKHTAKIIVTYKKTTGSGPTEVTATAEVTFTVIKASATVEAPQAIAGLTYNGTDLALVTAGSVSGVNGCGEMQYSLTEGSDFSTTIPTGKDADTYTVYWQVANEDETNFNYTGDTSGSVDVTISKTASKIEVSAVTVTYGENIKLTATVNGINVSGISLMSAAAENKVRFTFKDGKYREVDVTYDNDDRKDSGKAEVTIAANEVKDYLEPNENEVTVSYGGSGNLEPMESVTMKVTVKPMPLNYTFTAESKTYDGTTAVKGSLKRTTNLVQGDSVEESLQEGAATAERADVGEQTVTVNPSQVTLSGDDAKYYEVGTVTGGTVTISKAGISSVTAPTAKNRTYNGTEEALVTAPGDVIGGTMMYALGNETQAEGEYSEAIPQKKDAGTYYVWYYVQGDDNHNDSAKNEVPVTIEQKTVTLTWKLDNEDNFNITYDGKAHEVTATADTDVEDENVTVTVENGTQSNAGTYTVTATGLVSGTGNANNYKLPSDPTKEYTITPATVSFTIGAEVKVAWPADELNGDPNPNGYTLGGSGTDYMLSMTYDSYTHTADVAQTEGEAVKIEAGAVNGFTVTYQRIKDSAGKDVTEDAKDSVRDAGTYEIRVSINPAESTGDVYNYVFKDQDAGIHTLKIGEITVEPYETDVSWTHRNYVYHGHTMHPEIRVLTPFNADDVQMTSGLPQDFDHEHPEMYTGNYLVAFAETEGSDVGVYTVTAKLYGKNAGNYTVTDPTEDVTIIPAPVTITVGDNTWIVQEDGTLSRNTVTLRPAWGAVTAAPDQDEGTDHQYPAAGSAIQPDLNTTIEYWKDGEKVEGTPTEPGAYQVWVTIGNSNFRHSATTNGESHNVGELVITDKPGSVSTYTVTFDPGYEGAPAGPAQLTGVFANQTVVIPPASGENEDGTTYALTRRGYSFLGWSYGGRTYQPNEELHMPAANVTFKAEWTNAVALDGTVLRESGSGDPAPVNGATVVLKHGSEEVAETVTDRTGAFDFGLVTPGIYNLEITCENGSGAKIVKTFLVVLEDSSTGGEYILPDVALNTVVEVTPGITAAVDMGGIVSGEDISDVYTADDRSTVRNAGTVEFKMTIQSATLTTEQAEEIPVPEDRIGMVLDLELTKTVTKSGGSSTDTDIHDTKIPVITVIHLPAELQGKSRYTIYRFHDMSNVGSDDTLEMQTITTSPNSDGEYLKLVRDGTAIEIHAEFYSTYVLTWQQSSGSTSFRVELPAETPHGKVTSDRATAAQRNKVTLTVTPDEGYQLGALTVTDRNGKPVELTDNGDGTYTFTMPYGKVTVEAEFVEAAAPAVTLTVTEAPAYGSDITLTATVTSDSTEAAGITGKVQFRAGGQDLGDPVDVENGVATLTVSAADAAGQKALFGENGTSTVTAEYSGNDETGPSTGTATVTVAKKALAYTVTAANKAYDGKTDVAVTLTPTNALFGDNVTLTATGKVEKADVGSYAAVDLTGITLSGGDARYYTVEASKNGVELASPVSIVEKAGGPALHGTVTQDGKPVAGATVTLRRGNGTVASATTGADGTYSFPNAAPGVYDIVVETKDGKIMTEMVTITDETGTEKELDLPAEDVSSVLDVQGMGTIVVVGGLDTVAKDHAVSGSTVTVTMTIKRETESTAGHAQAIKAVAGGRKLEYMEIGLEKTTETDGRTNTEALTTTRQLITIVIGFDLTGKSNVAVYRYHGGNVDTLTETANGSGEYIKLDQAGGTITLHVKNFSTYAIGYTQESQTPTQPDTPDTPDIPDAPGASGTPSTPGTSGIPGSSGTPSYDITIPPRTEGGTVGSNQTTAQSGSDVTLTVTPDEGYHFDSLTVTDGGGKPVELTDNGDGTYTFTMPSGKVTVEAEFVKCSSLAFTDLDVDAWYHDYTDYVIAHGLMQGIGGGLFGPDGTVSRAQMVTVLWNISDKPVVNYYMTYSDVSEDAWYAEAIRWAASEGIVDGYGNGKFGPNDTVTREQMAVMLYRYEQKYGGGGFSGEWMYRLPFTDLDKLSDWAFEAVAWCNMRGIMSGKSNDIFDPKGPAKRSEMAAILTRYLTQDKRYLISSR